MTIKYRENWRYRNLPVVRALLATNLLFAVAILVAWQMTLMVVLGPLGWAADQAIPSALTLDNLLAYPLLVFWAGPALATATGWVLLRGERYRAAFGVLMLPVLVMALLVAVYILVPQSV